MAEQGGLSGRDQVGREVLGQSHGRSDWAEWGWSLLILCPLDAEQEGKGG